MIRRMKRTVTLYIASIVVAWPQPGSAHAQEKPESSLSALFPVAGDIAAASIIDDTCVDNCSHGPNIDEAALIFWPLAWAFPRWPRRRAEVMAVGHCWDQPSDWSVER